jgi:hypothetical protein
MCLGFAVSSLEARHRQAQRVVAIVYLGIPLVFLGLTLWISSETGNWPAALVPLALLAIGWWWRGKSRYQPATWRLAGFVMGGVAAVFTAFHASLALWFLPIGIAGAILGVALAGYGFRQLMSPAIPELADSPYELTFRMRGLTRLRLSIGTDQVTLHELMVAQSAEGREKIERDKSYPLTAVTGVHAVELSGHERLKYPVTMKLAPASSPGPALILQAQGDDWVLPHNEAPAIAEILNHRITPTR